MSLLTQFYPSGSSGTVGTQPAAYATDPVYPGLPDSVVVSTPYGAVEPYGQLTSVSSSFCYQTIELNETSFGIAPTATTISSYIEGADSAVTTLKNFNTIVSPAVTSTSLNISAQSAGNKSVLTTVEGLNAVLALISTSTRTATFSFTDFQNLTNVTAGIFTFTDGGSNQVAATNLTWDFSNNALSQASVDSILAAVDPVVHSVSSAGTWRVLLNGGTNAAPSAAGIASKNALVAAGWVVTTN